VADAVELVGGRGKHEHRERRAGEGTEGLAGGGGLGLCGGKRWHECLECMHSRGEEVRVRCRGLGVRLLVLGKDGFALDGGGVPGAGFVAGHRCAGEFPLRGFGGSARPVLLAGADSEGATQLGKLLLSEPVRLLGTEELLLSLHNGTGYIGQEWHFVSTSMGWELRQRPQGRRRAFGLLDAQGAGTPPGRAVLKR